MPNPLHEAVDWVKTDLPNLPTGTVGSYTLGAATASAKFPTDAALDHVHVQVGWDGTPSDADNREDVAIRLTYWAPKGQTDVAIDAAEGGRARLLAGQASGRPNIFRVDRGAGRLFDVDPDTDLPFCSFTCNVVLHAATP